MSAHLVGEHRKHLRALENHQLNAENHAIELSKLLSQATRRVSAEEAKLLAATALQEEAKNHVDLLAAAVSVATTKLADLQKEYLRLSEAVAASSTAQEDGKQLSTSPTRPPNGSGPIKQTDADADTSEVGEQVHSSNVQQNIDHNSETGKGSATEGQEQNTAKKPRLEQTKEEILNPLPAPSASTNSVAKSEQYPLEILDKQFKIGLWLPLDSTQPLGDAQQKIDRIKMSTNAVLVVRESVHAHTPAHDSFIDAPHYLQGEERLCSTIHWSRREDGSVDDCGVDTGILMS